jgi:hypothetical protein
MNILAIIITALLSALLTSALVSSHVAKIYKCISELLDLFFEYMKTDFEKSALLLTLSREIAILRGNKDWDYDFEKLKETLHDINTRQK